MNHIESTIITPDFYKSKYFLEEVHNTILVKVRNIGEVKFKTHDDKNEEKVVPIGDYITWEFGFVGAYNANDGSKRDIFIFAPEGGQAKVEIKNTNKTVHVRYYQFVSISGIAAEIKNEIKQAVKRDPGIRKLMAE